VDAYQTGRQPGRDLDETGDLIRPDAAGGTGSRGRAERAQATEGAVRTNTTSERSKATALVTTGEALLAAGKKAARTGSAAPASHGRRRARKTRRDRGLHRPMEAAALMSGGSPAVTIRANRPAVLRLDLPISPTSKATRGTVADKAGFESRGDCRPAVRDACSARRMAFNRPVVAERKA